MKSLKIRGLAICVAGLFLASSSVALAASGEAVAVVQQALIKSDGNTSALSDGQPVNMGDIIATGATGQAQIIFPDETKIVVGPNSQITIDKVLFRNENTARRISVSAVRGSFRFLSGDSPSRAYRVKTPTGTMGVRGTAFDVAVQGGENTDLVVFDGEVEICARGSRCARVPGGCQTVSLNGKGEFSQPKTVEERASKLDAFPFARQQSSLGTGFQVNNALCRSDSEEAQRGPKTLIRQIKLPSDPASAALRDGGADTTPSPSPSKPSNPAE